MGRRVMVVGAGGREHALAWRLFQSPSVDAVVTAPGNPGTEALGPRVAVEQTDPVAVADAAETQRVDLVVVGPEAPLLAGVADELARRELPVFGPSAAAARIEGSKAFAKQIMVAAGAPTGGYVATDDRDTAIAALERFDPPYVVKADGLAAGKGVRILDDLPAARDAVDDAMLHDRFGEAGRSVVVEEFLDGPERSVFAVCDGEDVVLLMPTQDHKRALDGDRGENTGGMGAFAPVATFTPEDAAPLADTVFRPVLAELASRGTPYRGLLYAGLVDTVDGPKLLEFNARFGDPETQVLMPLLASDLAHLLAASASGSVGDVEVAWHEGAAVTVVLASGGYPGVYSTGHAIRGIGDAATRDGVVVFHAGTAIAGGQLVTAGGRVLAVTARGVDLADARDRAYDAAECIDFDGRHLRRDIGA